MLRIKRAIFFLCCSFFLLSEWIFSQEKTASTSWKGELMNGVCWAEYNVDEPGRFANPGHPYGMLYQWNRKKGWPALAPDRVAGWDSSLEPGNTWEAANDPCPAGWRMPTLEEIKSLLDRTKVTSTETAQDGVFGTRYRDNTTGNAVFFPRATIRDKAGVKYDLLHKHYWSSTDHWTLYWEYPEPQQQPYAFGYSVRCVIDENACDIVLNISETICKEKLPYTWNDTIFMEGTQTGEYCFRRTRQATGCDSIVYFYLTVDTLCGKPCKERGVQINGVCWAESNVERPNTFADTPEAFGMLYQWNRKKALPLRGPIGMNDWDNPQEKHWEARNNPCPSEWHIPTMEELNTLWDDSKVTHEWTQQNGVNGRKFTDKVSGNTVFFPVAGSRTYPTDFGVDTTMGVYWSNSDASPYDAGWSTIIHRDATTSINIWPMPKNVALSVRCIAGQDTTGCGNIITDTSLVVCANKLPYDWNDTTFDIGTESGTYRFQYTNAVTGCDSIVRLHLYVYQPQEFSFSDAVCFGSRYTKNGFHIQRVVADTVIRDTFQTFWGCDSIRTLSLTVYPVYDTTLYDTICEDDSYNNHGFNLPAGTPGGTFTETYSTIHGCDSSVTLHLHVHPAYLFPETKHICQGDTITFHGRQLYKTGVYYDSLTTIHGCDSIFRMNLTVHPSPQLPFSDAICFGSRYTKNGFHIRRVVADTVIRDTFQTFWGCDSIRTLSLTVHPAYDTTLYDTICEGDSYNNHGFNLPAGTPGGTFTETYSTIHGCDSSVTLHLHVHPAYLFPETKHICQGDTITFRGRHLYKTGVYDDSLTTIHGCDSIFRMNLTVHPVSRLYFTDAVCYGNRYSNHGFNLPAIYTDTIVSDTFQSIWGCDSIRTLSLTVHPVYDTLLYDTVCQGNSYHRYGFSLSDVQSDGLHRLSLLSQTGCDSTLWLQLTVQPVYYQTLYDSICPSERYDKYGFHLSALKASGTYRLPLYTVHGCDSILTLELHVYPTYFYSRTENICEGDTFDFRGRRLYESGVYYDSLTTMKGCDSVYCLYLTVRPVYDVPLSGILCEGSPYTQDGFHVTTPGIHYRYLKSAFGCDSTLTLTLSEEKKTEGSIELLLEDCSMHGYSFFFEPAGLINFYQWDMGDGTVLRSKEGYHHYADSGTYRIQLHTETYNGCENVFSYVQHVPPYLREVPVYTDRQVIDEDYPTVNFRTDVLPGMKCRWDFGDGTTAEGDSVSHTYNATTEKYYDVTLKVMNADSCVTESGMKIEVVFLPKTTNTFSPNDDGINDVFMPDYRIEIIDRNGLRIYTGDNGWDGSYKGRQAKEDTYFYRLHYRTANGERQKTGYVTLIR